MTLQLLLQVLAREAEKVSAAVLLPANVKFQRARKLIRDALTEAGIAPRIEKLVARVLDTASPPARAIPDTERAGARG